MKGRLFCFNQHLSQSEAWLFQNQTNNRRHRKAAFAFCNWAERRALCRPKNGNGPKLGTRLQFPLLGKPKTGNAAV